MEIVLTLPSVLPVEVRVALARGYLDGLVRTNRELIKRKLVPPIYRSGVVYQKEPPGVEEFADALLCFERGFGDCDDLAAWRVAELQEQGHRASLIFDAKPPRRGRAGWLIHCIVRLPNNREEDPSEILRP